MLLPKFKEQFTYQDYLSWPDEERWELIDGDPTMMSPASKPGHQSVILKFGSVLERSLSGKPCVPFIAPIDVVLSDLDVVQPDIIVVCDKTKITDKNIQGAPDLIIEVLSPATARRDRWEKKALYEKHGVKEYILIDPDSQYVERYFLNENGLYDRGENFGAQDTLALKSLPGIEIPLWEVFGVEKVKIEK